MTQQPPAKPRIKPHILVVGFPKSGTTTLHKAFSKSGLKSGHWDIDGAPIGRLIYDGFYRHGDPFHHLDGFDAITQMDYCQKEKTPDGEQTFVNVWPNLDIALLLAIRRSYPDCKFILNYRRPAETASSIARWHNLQKRITRHDCPNLPKGFGSQADLTKWIDTHHQTLRSVFRNDPNFLEYDIAAPDARAQVENFIGQKLAWWGVANANRTNPEGPDQN